MLIAYSFIMIISLQNSSLELVKSAAKKFIDFVNNGPSPYHGMLKQRT